MKNYEIKINALMKAFEEKEKKCMEAIEADPWNTTNRQANEARANEWRLRRQGLEMLMSELGSAESSVGCANALAKRGQITQKVAAERKAEAWSTTFYDEH